MNYRRSASIFALAFLLPLLCPAQPLPGGPADDSLASYLKEWRWESPDGRSALDVSSSGLMLFDGNLYDYELSGGGLRFLSGGKPFPIFIIPRQIMLHSILRTLHALSIIARFNRCMRGGGPGGCLRRPSSFLAGTPQVSGASRMAPRNKRR